MRTSRLKNIVIVILLLVNVFLLVLLLSRRAEERGANERRIKQLCELFERSGVTFDRALLPEGGAVWFKTDNGPLFDWSLESFRGCGWALADMPEGTPMTDYEARFTEMGLPIRRVVATRP